MAVRLYRVTRRGGRTPVQWRLGRLKQNGFDILAYLD